MVVLDEAIKETDIPCAKMASILRLIFVVFVGIGASASASSDEPQPKWGPSVSFEAKPGNERTLGEIDLFAPLWQDDRSMVFGNVRGQGDTDDNLEGNVGLGYRRILDSDWIVGGYGYFDYRYSENNNGFVQGTLGVEALSVDWDFRGQRLHSRGRHEECERRHWRGNRWHPAIRPRGAGAGALRLQRGSWLACADRRG